jgi:hypothetical protein
MIWETGMSQRDKIADSIVKALEGKDYFHHEQVLNSGDARPVREPYLTPSKIGEGHLDQIADEAVKNLDKDLMAFNQEAAIESALELTIRDFSDGEYDGKIDAESYLKLKGLVEDRKKTGGNLMKRTASYYTGKLDKIANEIRNLVVAGELSPEQGYELEYALDEVSDEIEKQAAALEHDADEEYMKDFGKDPATKEHDADEKYMKDFHNGGQNVVSESLKKASLDARKLAEKRK